jgi:hypothetical protein
VSHTLCEPQFVGQAIVLRLIVVLGLLEFDHFGNFFLNLNNQLGVAEFFCQPFILTF